MIAIQTVEAATAYLGFMNAVGLQTRTDVRIDGRSLKPAGFPEGNYVESFGLPVGAHSLVFANADCAPLTQSIQVQSAPAPLFILYNTPVSQPTGRPKQVLRLLTIPGQPPAHAQRRFLVVYASAQPAISIKINASVLNVPSGKVINLSETSLDVATGAGEPVHYEPSRPGNYVLVLFDGSDARLHQALVQME